MSDSSNISSGENTQASGESDKVAYETYQKALREKKNAQEKLNELSSKLEAYEAKLKQEEEMKLKEKEDFKSLLQLREKELGEFKSKYEQTQNAIMEGMKFNSFLKSLSGKLDDAYHPLVDLSSIPIDPNTNLPDQASIQKAAQEFEQKYARIIEKPNGARLPSSAATDVNAPSLESFKSAKTAKEKREALAAAYAQFINKGN